MKLPGWLLMDEKYGIHTIELYANNLKYSQVQKVIDRLIDKGEIQKLKGAPYNVDSHWKSQYFVKVWVLRMTHQDYKMYGLKI